MISWNTEEKEYLTNRVTKDKVHPRDVWAEMLKKFPDRNRTYTAIVSWLKDNDISYKGLVRNKDKKQIRLDKVGQVAMVTEAEMREELSKKGYKVEKLEVEKVDRKFKIDTSMFEGDKIKFGVLSCSHLGSKFQQLTFLKNFYQRANERGCKFMLHCGDLVDGIRVYRGHEYELFLHGEKAQKDYAIAHYPKLESGGKTYVIDGNHDYSFYKENGSLILEDIAKEREDIIYCGSYGAYPKLESLMNIYIAHGEYGVSYARSYRLQKNIEQFAPAAKPDVYFIGHFHVTTALFQYRNVTAFMVPCFQSQTPYLRRKGLYPEVGGLIIEFTINDYVRKAGIAGLKFEWIPFFIPKENDY